ncbi:MULTISPECIES: hypothetical protein [Xanthomonas]|nr:MULTISPECIES: hypothetical protein [Xanthomonas]
MRRPSLPQDLAPAAGGGHGGLERKAVQPIDRSGGLWLAFSPA